MFKKNLHVFYTLIGILSIWGFSYIFVVASSEFLQYADRLAEVGIINKQGTEYGYRLQSSISRAESVKLILGVANMGQRDCRFLSSFSFSDVSSNLGSLCGYIEGAVANSIVESSSSGTSRFFPNVAITR